MEMQIGTVVEEEQYNVDQYGSVLNTRPVDYNRFIGINHYSSALVMVKRTPVLPSDISQICKLDPVRPLNDWQQIGWADRITTDSDGLIRFTLRNVEDLGGLDLMRGHMMAFVGQHYDDDTERRWLGRCAYASVRAAVLGNTVPINVEQTLDRYEYSSRIDIELRVPQDVYCRLYGRDINRSTDWLIGAPAHYIEMMAPSSRYATGGMLGIDPGTRRGTLNPTYYSPDWIRDAWETGQEDRHQNIPLTWRWTSDSEPLTEGMIRESAGQNS